MYVKKEFLFFTDIEKALCVNAGELLDPKTAFQLALGNLDPFSLKKMDDWHPDHRPAVRHYFHKKKTLFCQCQFTPYIVIFTCHFFKLLAFFEIPLSSRIP